MACYYNEDMQLIFLLHLCNGTAEIDRKISFYVENCFCEEP